MSPLGYANKCTMICVQISKQYMWQEHKINEYSCCRKFGKVVEDR